jgi:hypothetical protein
VEIGVKGLEFRVFNLRFRVTGPRAFTVQGYVGFRV